MVVVSLLLEALQAIAQMAWQIGWSLVLGFFIAACIESLVRKETVAGLLPDDGVRSVTTAAGLGAASSSCSYAAVAMARSLVRKGASFTSAMTFQIASTNLVLELGIILAIILGWQFTAAQLVGGPIMIVVVVLLLHRFVKAGSVDAARIQADRGLAGSMEGHASMDMSVQTDASALRRLMSRDG